MPLRIPPKASHFYIIALSTAVAQNDYEQLSAINFKEFKLLCTETVQSSYRGQRLKEHNEEISPMHKPDELTDKNAVNRGIIRNCSE